MTEKRSTAQGRFASFTGFRAVSRNLFLLMVFILQD